MLVTGFLNTLSTDFLVLFPHLTMSIFLAITSHRNCFRHGNFLGKPKLENTSKLNLFPEACGREPVRHVHVCGPAVPFLHLSSSFWTSRSPFFRCPLPPFAPSLTIPWLFSARYWGVSNPIKATQPQTWMIDSLSLCPINLYFKITCLLSRWISNESWIRHSIEMKNFRLWGTQQSKKLKEKVGMTWRSWARHD